MNDNVTIGIYCWRRAVRDGNDLLIALQLPPCCTVHVGRGEA